MDAKRLLDALCVFSSGYVKRWAESNVYDKFFETRFGARLQDLPTSSKYAIEAGLNLLTVFFDQKLSHDSALARLVHDLATDVAPEVSARMHRDVRVHLENCASGPAESRLVATLLELEPKALASLLDWLYAVESDARTRLLSTMAATSAAGLANLAALAPEARERLLHVVHATDSTKDQPQPSFLDGLNQRWRDWISRRKASAVNS